MRSSSATSLCIFVLITGLGFGVAQTKDAAGSPKIRQRGSLQLHVPVEQEISGGQTDEYAVEVKAGQFLHVVAEQKKVDVVLSIEDPAGNSAVTSDTPNGSVGTEPASIIANVDGPYHVKVSVLNPAASPGEYSLEVTDLRAPQDRDALRIKAEKTLSEAAILLVGNSENRQKSTEPLKQAAADFHQLGDEYEEGLSLNVLGLLASESNDKQQAQKYYEHALVVRRAAGDRYGEAATLNNLARVFSDLWQKDKALKCNQDALPIWRHLGDRSGEAATLNLIGRAQKDLGQNQQALESYQQALAIVRELKDRSSEATVLNNLGNLLDELGEKRKALDYLQQASGIYHDVGDREAEATTLNNTGVTYLGVGETQKALESLQQALTIRQQINDRNGIGTTLSNLGLVSGQGGETHKALDYFQQALPILRELGNRGGEAQALSNIGGVYAALGDKQKALETFQTALPIQQQIGDRGGSATTMNNIGTVYAELGEQQKALDLFQQSLTILRELGARSGIAQALNNIGSIYTALGDQRKAIDYFQQALPIQRATGDRNGEATTLTNMGHLSAFLGERQKALAYYEESLPIFRAVGSRRGEATTLNNIALVYASLGEYQKALDQFQQALPVVQASGDRNLEALALNNIGQSYQFLGDQQKALEFFLKSLPIAHAIGDRRGEGVLLNNVAGIYAAFGQTANALQCYQQALDLERAIGNRHDEALILNAMAQVYVNSGDEPKALGYFESALPIDRAVGDREGEARALFGLSRLWQSQHDVPLAIYFGKQAVNLLQGLRGDIAGLDKQTQKTYLSMITAAYRNLADLLLAEGRLPEAEEVLGMLKEQEFKQFTRGAVATPSSSRTAPLTAGEQHAESILSQGLEWQELRDSANRTPEQQTRYDDLGKALTANNVDLSNFWLSVNKALPAEDSRRQSKVEASATQKLLRDLPDGTVVVYTLVLDDKLDLIVVDKSAMVHKSVAVKRAELANTVEQFRSAIRDQKQSEELLTPAHHLYEWLVAPIAGELEGVHARTIAWSLDGILRYIPISALYDGQHYLIERYINVIYTPADIAGLEKKPAIATWKALGVGVSKQYEKELNALPAVPAELRTIVRDKDDLQSHGPLPGRILLDDAFTEQALEKQLEQHYPLVHIASHFVMGLGTDESYLLLGGKEAGGQGYRLRLSDAGTWQNLSFDSTALLVLSACQTAMSNPEADGKEVDSLATIGRERGAQAVVASLWDVNDASTGRLMADFYRRWSGTASLTKAEALREAQLTLLQAAGSNSRQEEKSGRGVQLEDDAKLLRSPYSHPYYWAAFILMGNWQ